MRQTARLSILFFLMVMTFGSLSSAQVRPNIMYGGSVDNTQPSGVVPPCATMGYSVETTLTLSTVPTAQWTLEFMRINRTSSTVRTGYVVARQTVTQEKRLITYDTRTMTVIASVTINNPAVGKYTSGTQSGDTDNDVLYLARLVNNGAIFGCTAGGGFPCVSMSKFDMFGNMLGESIAGTLATANIDDARIDNSTLLLLGSGASRYYQTWSVPGGSFIANSALTGIGSTGIIALGVMDGFKYVGFTDVAKTIHKLAASSTTISATGTFAGNFALNNTLGAILTFAPQASLLIGESISFGGINASRGYLSNTLVNVGSTSYVLANGSASAFGTFYDYVNNRMHGFRFTPGVAITNQILRTTPDTGVVEQAFTCSPACTGGGAVPLMDFNVNSARLFVAGNDGVNNTVSRIKVCATGGPSA